MSSLLKSRPWESMSNAGQDEFPARDECLHLCFCSSLFWDGKNNRERTVTVLVDEEGTGMRVQRESTAGESLAKGGKKQQTVRSCMWMFRTPDTQTDRNNERLEERKQRTLTQRLRSHGSQSDVRMAFESWQELPFDSLFNPKKRMSLFASLCDPDPVNP